MTTTNLNTLSRSSTPSRALVRALPFAAYVGGSVVVWTVLGMSPAALLGQVLSAVVPG